MWALASTCSARLHHVYSVASRLPSPSAATTRLRVGAIGALEVARTNHFVLGGGRQHREQPHLRGSSNRAVTESNLRQQASNVRGRCTAHRWQQSWAGTTINWDCRQRTPPAATLEKRRRAGTEPTRPWQAGGTHRRHERSSRGSGGRWQTAEVLQQSRAANPPLLASSIFCPSWERPTHSSALLLVLEASTATHTRRLSILAG